LLHFAFQALQKWQDILGDASLGPAPDVAPHPTSGSFTASSWFVLDKTVDAEKILFLKPCKHENWIGWPSSKDETFNDQL
jgi:hypothetical protein